MQFRLRTLFVFAFLLIMALLLIQQVSGPVLPRRVLHRLPGMQKSQVRQLFGSPSKVYESSWIYERRVNPGWVEIYFDDDVSVGAQNQPLIGAPKPASLR